MGIFLLKHCSFASLLLVLAEIFSFRYMCIHTPFYYVSRSGINIFQSCHIIVNTECGCITEGKDGLLRDRRLFVSENENSPISGGDEILLIL